MPRLPSCKLAGARADNALKQFFKAWSPRSVGWSAALITVGIWTAFIVIARASAQATLSPYDIALARIVGAALILLPLGAWLARQDRAAGSNAQASFWGLSPLSARVTATCGLFGGLGYALLSYAGFFYAPAAHAAVLMPGSLPLWTTLLASLMLGAAITRARLLGLACIVLGALLVGGVSLLRAFDGGTVWKGDLLFLGAGFCWSTYSVLARRYRLDAVRATTAVTVFAFLSYLPIYALLLTLGLIQSRFAQAGWGEILFQLVFQGMCSVVISGMTFVRMIEYYGPVRSTMLTALVPGLSALGAVIFLDEPLVWNLLAGLLLVTAGIVVGVRNAR